MIIIRILTRIPILSRFHRVLAPILRGIRFGSVPVAEEDPDYRQGVPGNESTVFPLSRTPGYYFSIGSEMLGSWDARNL